MRLTRSITIPLIALVVVAIGWLYLQWPRWRYRGPGQFSDSGVISYPRFHIRFPPLRLDKASTATYTYRGVPTERMDFQLFVHGAGERNRPQLEHLDTRIRATIIEDESSLVPRITICKAEGSPSSKTESSRWVLMTGSDIAAFWHAACLGKQFRSSATYTLTIAIEPDREESPTYALVPTLEGGGIELP
jgi:hypothetical protein